MIRFLRWLITGDGHKHSFKLTERLEYGHSAKIKGYIYVCTCEYCGKMEVKRVDVL